MGALCLKLVSSLNISSKCTILKLPNPNNLIQVEGHPFNRSANKGGMGQKLVKICHRIGVKNCQFWGGTVC